jgi:hypothetical protein
MPTMNLESLKQAVQAKYEPLTVDEPAIGGKFDLVQPLRLGEKDLRALTKAQAEYNKIGQPEPTLDEDGKELPLTEEQEEEQFNVRPKMIAALREIILIPADNKERCTAYLDLIGDDLAMLAEFVSQDQESSEVGEA